jgi:signal transduction histidine kinase
VSEKPQPSRRRFAVRSLSGRFALGSWLATTASLMLFALVAFVVVVVSELAEPNAPTRDEIDWEAGRDVIMALLLALPVGMGIAVGGSLWLTRRTLAPIADVIRAASEMTAQNLARRLPVPAQDDELRALVIAQNALFERLEAGFGAVSRFAASASHEIRTPLAVVESELEIALRRPRSEEEWRRSAQRSLDELQRLNRVVEALFEYARVDGIAPTTGRRASARIVVDALLSSLASLAEPRGLTLSLYEAPQEEVWVRISSDALGIVLSNLLSNALRYTPAGGTICVVIEHPVADRVVIHVDDSGPGVAAAELNEIFSPFVRGLEGNRANHRDVQHAGLGLGLSMAKRIVESHAGALSIARSPANGARFSVALPLAAGAT